MADDVTVDPSLRKKLEDIKISDEPSTVMAGSSKVKEPMGLKTSLHPQKEMSGSSQVKELTEGNLRGQSPIQVKLPSELNDALSDTRRLHVFDLSGWSVYKTRHGSIVGYLTLKNKTSNSGLLSDWTQGEVSVIRYEIEYHRQISWTIDDDGAWIVFESDLPLNLLEIIPALVPLCQKVEHITTSGFDKDLESDTHGSQPIVPMRSVLAVCLHAIVASLHDSLQIVSRCFPNAKSLVLDCEFALFESASRHHSGIPLSSLRRLELRIRRYCGTLDNLFLLLSSFCQNIEFLTVTSYRTLKWEKSRTAITECKLPNLTDIHLESRWYDEHYALQMITDLLHLGRTMSPSLKFVKVKNVELGDVVMKSVEWSRTSSDCGLQIQGASLLPEELVFRYALRKSAAVPITELIDITTSEFKEVTVLTLVSCNIDIGQSERKSPQSPKELGTLREIRFVGSENPLSESDRNKLSELYPNVKVTEKQESQESSEESQEGAGIPSKLDKASSQSLKTSAIDELVEEKVKFHVDTASQNLKGGEEEISWQKKGEEFDVNKGSLSNESAPDEGNIEPIKKECCKTVGADGGKLQLESFGIELEIPPGAIDSKEPQEISLRVLTDTPNLGDTKDEMSVCFGVQCLAPDDLVLRSPVTYTIPHCAVATLYSRLEAVLYTGEGEYIPDAEVKARILLRNTGLPNCIIERGVLRLQIDHFSWIYIKFIKNLFFRGKQMCCLPFAEKPLPEERMSVIMRVHLFDDLTGGKKMVVQEEEDIGFARIHPATEIPINVTEEDVTMTCFLENDRVGEAIVEYDDLWRGKDRMASFKLDLTNQPDRVIVDLKVGQNGQRQRDLTCVLKFASHCRSSSFQPHDIGQLEGATGQTPLQQTEATPELPEREVIDRDISRLARLLPHEKYSELCQQLGFEYNYTQKILVRNSQDFKAAFEDVLHEWKDKDGSMVDLDRALRNSYLGGLICKYKK
ncbi:uncharacterized protein LOC135153106 [Lytechinus pictus]|uniref:uncharacterized protein LOC135153106 n=1 Tax=Lytechinus pictus TaxID=7653 RepID=UPI0030BA14E7